MEEGFNFSGMDSLGGSGGFSGSSGVSGDDEQSFSSGIGGIDFGDFMTTNNSTLAPTWVWVVLIVLAFSFFMIKGR